ncbi:similar to Saccharomyces cerevisiae YFR008W FAR7 Protein involved in recovery from cell cycle arrest in response to pheromone, in a Far1p-independent pathway [Maudiozyma saulgeensis]|uniref:Similar to Saccharomyces cerevisiae YFR008W FAR7 Protein involved in recovery from cell cycle arrest in response to pheromone, in a Far1p-independent pathway n=1 Tax=Maudiozyma saulgeensis TaxID=1789683 RepID=A0A1X7QYM9_9SACH|nr:similar to Saccharomyces cerevisiae YFR008W FAR7 Protein involved in recovery from cell cycle arrest in response to pheromone, in a Far1p-independent pathway [Kazachstania saulgeensis]
MSFNNNNGGNNVVQQQQQQQSQQSQQQQHLFMNPQTENLQQLYTLVQELVEQINQNKKQKAQILNKIDTLSNHINREPEKIKENYKKDIIEFNNFLDMKIGSYSSQGHSIKGIHKVTENGDSDKDGVEILKLQNKKLKELLESEQRETLRSFEILGLHEEGFHKIVGALRSDIINYRKAVLAMVSGKFQNEVIPKENTEFEVYMDNIDDFQKLLKISELYRTILKILNSNA